MPLRNGHANKFHFENELSYGTWRIIFWNIVANIATWVDVSA